MSNPTSKSLAEKHGEPTPPSNGFAHRLLYWITLLVVVLIIGQIVLDAFGVQFFPRRSWSEGISAKVVQVRDRALYFEFIDMKVSDIKTTLPPGVEPHFLGVTAVINPSDVRAKLFLRAMTIPEDLFLLAVVWLLRSMALSTWKNPTAAVTPFIRANVWRIRWIAALIAALWVYHLCLPTLTGELSFFTPLNDYGAKIAETLPWFVTNGPLGVALLLLVLAEVFSHGVRLQKDVEGLV